MYHDSPTGPVLVTYTGWYLHKSHRKQVNNEAIKLGDQTKPVRAIKQKNWLEKTAEKSYNTDNAIYLTKSVHL